MRLFHQNGNGEAVFRGNLLEQNLNHCWTIVSMAFPVAVIFDDDLIDDFVIQRQGFPGGIIETTRRGQVDRREQRNSFAEPTIRSSAEQNFSLF